MESVQSSGVLDESVDRRYAPAPTGHKRKRQCSQTSTEEDQTPPPQKKATPCEEQKQTVESAGSQSQNNNSIGPTVTDQQYVDDDRFSLEQFCDEVLYEILKFLDTWSLMTLMNVSNRFQKLVLDKRLWEEIDLSQEPLPLGILEDMLERSHEKTRSIKLRGPSPSQHIACEIQHFNITLRNSLTTRCTNLVTMELFGITLDFNQLTFKDFPVSLKRLAFSNCHVRFDGNKSIFTGIDTILINLEELAIEQNAWFDPYYIMPIAKLPILKYLSLKGCSQMQEFIPYGSIAGRHGFKQLEILDLCDTPLNDSDLQCFNAVETLKEIYLQCPAEDIKTENENSTNVSTSTTNSATENQGENQELSTSTSSTTMPSEANGPSELGTCTPNASFSEENPSPSSSTSGVTDYLRTMCCPEYSSSSSSTSSSSSQSSPNAIAPADASVPVPSSLNRNPLPNVIPLVGSNTPPRSRFLPRPDHIIYLDCLNRNSNAVHISLRDRNNVREPRMVVHRNLGPQLQSPPLPAFEQMIRHNLFWDIINPLGRVAGGGGPDRLFAVEEEIEYGGVNIHQNPFNAYASSRPVQRGSISDRGVCCFGRTREPVQHGVIWIRFNNRPVENRFERFSVRDYKSVTDTSLEHLVQCSPHLVFLDVSGTSVTMKGIRHFKDLKPECKVVAEHLLSTVL